MTTAFLQALQAKRTMPEIIEKRVSDLAKKSAESIKHAINPSPVIPVSDLIPNQAADKPVLKIERVLNRNRIDLFFSSKPDNDILGSLHGNGWHFRPSDKAWYNKDCEATHHYLKVKFNIILEDSKSIESPIEFQPDEQRFESRPELTSAVIDNSEPRFEEFKSKVNRLVEYFKIEPADLMLLAIDALFEKHENELN